MRIFQFTGIWMRIFREVSAIVMLSTTSCLRAVASPGWTVSDRIPVGGAFPLLDGSSQVTADFGYKRRTFSSGA